MAVVVLSALFAGNAQGAYVEYNFSFSGGADSAPDMTGNVLTYSDVGAQTTLKVTAWADVGAGVLEAAVAYDTTGGNGLAVCNSAEGVGAGISRDR